jgi:DNA replication protein DnaC
MTLSFMADASNVMLMGPNGVGKSMLACNLAALDSDSALRRRLKHYAAPDLLLIDEVGYLSYSNRHAHWDEFEPYWHACCSWVNHYKR